MGGQRQALVVSSGNGPAECRQAVAHVLDIMRVEADRTGLDIDISIRGTEDQPVSAIVCLAGKAATRMATEWEGVILWRCQSAFRPGHRRRNWFIQVFRFPNEPPALAIAPSEIEMQAIRAGGPGGQHQNKTSSAIRAAWKSPEGNIYSVVVRDDRSQHRNRSIAVQRLGSLVAADRAAAEAGQKRAIHHLHRRLERGNPARIFEGPGFRPA